MERASTVLPQAIGLPWVVPLLSYFRFAVSICLTVFFFLSVDQFRGLYNNGVPVPYTLSLESAISAAGLPLPDVERPLDEVLMTANTVCLNDGQRESRTPTGSVMYCPSKDARKQVLVFYLVLCCGTVALMFVVCFCCARSLTP